MASTLNSLIENSTSTLVSLPHSCSRRSNSTSRLLLAGFGQERVPETYLHRIIFMPMMNKWEGTGNPHKNDGLRIQQAQEVRDHEARFRPGYWMFVGAGSENTWTYDNWETDRPNGNWDRQTSQILRKCEEPGHPVVLGITIFKQP